MKTLLSIISFLCISSLFASVSFAQEDTVLKKDQEPAKVVEIRRADQSLVRITRLETASPMEISTVDAVREDSFDYGIDQEMEEEIDGGLLHLDVWSSDTAEANIALQFGGDYFNVFFAGGADMTVAPEAGEREWQVGMGFGTRIPVWRVFFDLDLAIYGRLAQDGEPLKTGLAKARLGLGYRFATHFAVFAGASANLMADADLGFIGMDTTVDSPTYLSSVHNIDVDGPLRLTAWPGFYAGFEL